MTDRAAEYETTKAALEEIADFIIDLDARLKRIERMVHVMAKNQRNQMSEAKS